LPLCAVVLISCVLVGVGCKREPREIRLPPKPYVKSVSPSAIFKTWTEFGADGSRSSQLEFSAVGVRDWANESTEIVKGKWVWSEENSSNIRSGTFRIDGHRIIFAEGGSEWNETIDELNGDVLVLIDAEGKTRRFEIED
jgi:hypothetical protein